MLKCEQEIIDLVTLGRNYLEVPTGVYLDVS